MVALSEMNIIVWREGETGNTHYSPFLCKAESDGNHLFEIEFLFCPKCPTFYEQMKGLGINPERGDQILNILSKDLIHLQQRLDPFSSF